MKHILVTGATSGIGEAVARYLAKQGYSVVLTGRNKEKLHQMLEELGKGHFAFPCDLSQLEQAEKIFSFCEEQGFKLDGMVHCAGIFRKGPLRAEKIDDVQAVMNMNCMAFVALCKAMINRKYSNDGASIVAVSSLSSRVANGGTLAYTMSKAAMDAAGQVLSKEVLKRKIRINSIQPAVVRTPMSKARDEATELIPIQPFGFIEPEEIAYLAEFLLSDKARCITGAHIPVSAGMNY